MIVSALLALAMAAALLSGITAPPEPAAASLNGKLVPAGSAFFGAWVKPRTGWSVADVKNAVGKREAQLGRNLDIDQVYYGWGQNFPGWREQWDVANGRIPLLAWAATKTTSINQGQHDGYIRARADAIRRLGAPVFIRWFSEMDAAYQSEKSVSPAAFIAAWRRIVRIFRNRGATNAVWVWCGTAAGFGNGVAQTYYPGPTYVDWVCADGFNWAPRKPGSDWRSFRDIFQDFYNWGSTTGKPLMVAETGTEEGTVGRKAQWVTDARQVLKTAFQNIKAFVYFDTRASDAYGTYYNWWMDTSASSLQAFAAMARDPYFRWNRAYRPDALVTGPKGSFLGGDLYGDEGQQTVKAKLRRRRGTQLTVRIENDGNIGDVFRVWQEDAGKRLRVRYFLGGDNVTKEVKNGGLLTSTLNPGEAVDIRVQVKGPKKGRVGKRVRVGVASGSNKSLQDVVGAKLRRKRNRR